MRILANENVPGPLVIELRERGHDVEWIGESAAGIQDRQVVARARRTERLLLTLDKDYGHLVVGPGGSPLGAVLLRLAPLTVMRMAPMVGEVLDSRDDWAGHFSVLEPGRVRMIPLAAVPPGR